MRTILEIIGTAVVVGLAGGAVGYLVRKNVAEGKIATAEEQAIRIVQDAEQTGEAKRKEIMMEAKEEIHRLRSDMERENKDSSVRSVVCCKKKKIWTVKSNPSNARKKSWLPRNSA